MRTMALSACVGVILCCMAEWRMAGGPVPRRPRSSPAPVVARGPHVPEALRVPEPLERAEQLPRSLISADRGRAWRRAVPAPSEGICEDAARLRDWMLGLSDREFALLAGTSEMDCYLSIILRWLARRGGPDQVVESETARFLEAVDSRIHRGRR